jgi:hypothetical protein
MISMSALLGALSTPLAAQSAIGFGFAATLGDGWQIESGEIGYVRRVGGGPVRALSAGVRLGAFVDQGAILRGTRGFVAAGTLGARTGKLSLGELGDEHDQTAIGFDVAVEATGYLASNSPLPQRGRWAAVAVLPGLRIGGGGGTGPQYSLQIGPTVFFGSETTVRALLAFRIEAPLARREPYP